MPEHDNDEKGARTTPVDDLSPALPEGLAASWQRTSDTLREAERRYRELVEYSLGLICTHDLAGKILTINPAAANSLGYRPEDGIGRNLREFLSTETRHLFDDYLRRIQDLGNDDGLMRVVARTGAVRVWMYRNVLSHGPDGAAYVLGHAIDITERVAAERRLREHEKALVSAHAVEARGLRNAPWRQKPPTTVCGSRLPSARRPSARASARSSNNATLWNSCRISPSVWLPW